METDLKNSIGFIINRTAYRLRQRMQSTIKQSQEPLTTEELTLLIAIQSQDGLRTGELAKIMMRDSTTITRQLDGLDKKGLIRRENASQDRRVVMIWLTDQAKTALDNLIPRMLKSRQQILSGISEKDLQIAEKVLRKMQENLIQGTL